MGSNVDQVLADLREGKHLALARAITAIENGTPMGLDIMQATRRCSGGRSRSIGVSGPPGAGKSSLINALIAEFSARALSIGVLTVDPSSAASGGALLGDRVRMASHSKNPLVFIRSLASRGHLGGLTRMTAAVMDVLDAAGMDIIIVETVGTGQSEIDIGDLANVTLIVCPPGLGDDMQAIKAGILEIADILVVNKSDLPGAEQTAMQLNAMLHSGAPDGRTVMLTDAIRGAGVSELVDAIDKRLTNLNWLSTTREERRTANVRRWLARDCASWVHDFVLRAEDPRVDALCRDIEASRVPHRDGVRAALQLIADASIDHIQGV